MTAPPAPAVRPRPRNRRRLIVEAACRAFSDRGYHAASMEEIAARVGITAAALYRHFPNKYALFAECANVIAGRLVAAADETPPGAALADVLAALARVTVAHRDSGGFYRWEARYLGREDREILGAKFARVTARVAEGVRREYPGPEADLRAVAALGVIGSVTAYRVPVTRRRTEEVLLASATGVIRSGPPAVAAVAAGGRPAELPARPAPRTRREEILAAAIPLLARDGFASVTNEQIARRAGLAPSAIYRHYPAKVDILVAACLQAADLLARAADRAVRDAAGPREAVLALAEAYVAYSFEHTALTSVAEAEIAGLPDELRRPLTGAQREHIAVWAGRLRAARPDLDAGQARMLVHAGFGVVVEAGRRLRWEDTARHRGVVAALVAGALGL